MVRGGGGRLELELLCAGLLEKATTEVSWNSPKMWRDFKLSFFFFIFNELLCL